MKHLNKSCGNEALLKTTRRGPYPLSVHIGLANAMANVAPDVAALIPAMLNGIKKYQAYESNVTSTLKPQVFFQDNEFRVLKYACPHGASTAPVVLVPSLINKYQIFDLTDDHSFVRCINDHGADAYVLDWGDLTQDPKSQTMDDIITGRLDVAVEKISNDQNSSVHGVGYCMGGTLLTASATLRPDCWESLSLMATPWDFHGAADSRFNNVLKDWKPSVTDALDKKEALPVENIQTLFAAIDVRGTINKFSRFSELDMDTADAQKFIAVEDWLNDGIALPSAIAKTCIDEWYGKNTTACNSWSIKNTIIDLSNIKAPSLIVASDRDKLVPFDMAVGLYRDLDHSQMLRLSCGHISMMAGRNCKESVWQKIMEFIVAKPEVKK